MHENFEEINKLTAGSELDSLVASRVMGWSPVTYLPDGSGTIPNSMIDGLSVDIGMAWGVVEKIRAMGNDVLITATSYRGVSVLIESDSHGPQYRMRGATAPEAICKAALFAMK